MLVELKLVEVQVALVNTEVINLFAYRLSDISESYQEKEVNSFLPIKADHYGQPNPFREIPNKKLKQIMPGMFGMTSPLRTSDSNCF